ncbi:MAG: M15 family metallopeptidase, partial [Treponema sp.]|nr:M15 family metallopeptidase [Treponema sp.]
MAVIKAGVFLLILSLFSCSPPQKNAPLPEAAAQNEIKAADNDAFAARLAAVMRNAQLPAALSANIQTAAAQSPAFTADLRACLAGDPSLRALVDKQHPLPTGYTPADLVTLTDGAYRVNRAGLLLRKAAAESLAEMAAEARKEGITLLASSSYRSYDYQVEVYNRNVREMGQEEADRESARPGHSQHQTGLVVDFGSIDNS